MSDSGQTLPPPGQPDEFSSSDSEVGPKPWWKKWWVIAIGVVVVLGGLGAAFGDDDESTPSTGDSIATEAEESASATEPSTTEAVADSQPEDSAAQAETTTPDTEPETTEPATTTTSTTSSTTTTSTTTSTTVPPLPGFGGGVVLVGVDVDPGLYAATVPSSGFGCYWERLSGLSGDFEEILANDNSSPGAHIVVALVDGDEAFSSDGCGSWVIYLPPEAPAADFGEGNWIVNQEIVPGRYRSTGPGPDDFGCYWERQSGVSGDFKDILANDNVDGPTIVDISGSDFAFKSNGCGDWTLAE